jgi:hypothetical protein
MKPILLALWAFALSPSLFAALTVMRYDLPNGSGVASSGNLNYWDRNYTGTGSTTTDGALLTGGLGDLTNNIIPTLNWDQVENIAGTGPYVGWNRTATPNPLVTFFFATPVAVTGITIHVDHSKQGGVSVPLSFAIGVAGGPLTTYAITEPAGTAPTSYTFNSLNLVGNAIDIRFNHRSDWIMASEVQFSGSVVPEPSAVMLSALGLGLLAWRIRRR